MILDLKIIDKSKIIPILKSILSRTLNLIVSFDRNADWVIKDETVSALKTIRWLEITLGTIYYKKSTFYTTSVLNLEIIRTLCHTLIFIQKLIINTNLTLIPNASAATLVFTLNSIISHISKSLYTYILEFHYCITYVLLSICYVYCTHYYF